MNLLKLKSNNRLFFVSDIHGELPTLLHALETLGFEVGKDLCIHAGDLFDRGRYNMETVNHFLDDDSGSFYTVLGNHCCFGFQNHDANTDESALWWINGGEWAFDQLTQEGRNGLASRLEVLPYVIEVDHNEYKFGVVHACVPQDFPSWDEFVGVLEVGNKNLLHEITWGREFVEYSKCDAFRKPLDGVKYTIHGHTPVKQPLLVGNRWHIDTGLVYGKYLTVAEVVDGELQFHKFEKVDV